MLLALLLSGCDKPPATAYVNGWNAGKPAAQVSIGNNTVGEACSLQATGAASADVYCGTWQQPSARIRAGDAAGSGDLARLVTASPWRVGIDQSYICQSPTRTTILDGRPAELLDCTQRRLGWPHVAVVALVNGRAWYGDGVKAAFNAMERAIGVQAGLFRADTVPPSSAADAVEAQRLAARVVSSGDIGQYDALMAAGTRANLDENPAAAEAAFRAALALQQKALGRDNPNTVAAVTTLALQLSNESRYAEAAGLFAEAGRLAPKASDPIAPARLLHYRGLDALNRGKPAEALRLLRAAGAAYAAQLPPGMASDTGADQGAFANGFSRTSLVVGREVLTDPAAQSALIGVIEARRNEAVALRALGKPDESRKVLASATRLAEGHGLARPILTARLFRSAALADASAGDTSLALTNLERSVVAFGRALPDSKPLAETTLLRVRELTQAGEGSGTLPLCQAAVGVLVRLKAGTTPALIAPCLDVYGAAAAAATDPARRQALLTEMFTASQLGQGGVTSQQIAQATARLQANARDPRVAAAIRKRQDASTALQTLVQKRDAISAAAASDPAAKAALSEIDAKVKAAEDTLAESDAALQAAAPNYGQLAQQVVPASAVFAGLRPNEALLQIALGPKDGWSMVLHHGQIAAARIPAGLPEIGKLVTTLRASIEPTTDELPTFDVTTSRKIYDLTIAGVAPSLNGVQNVVVVPSGPLLALPFEVLLSGPANIHALGQAPWLVRRFTLTHVPAPANFVSLRKTAGGSRATKPWFGFGAFVPLTLAQAEGSFPSATCSDSAKLLASLPPLPGARQELDAARELYGATDADWLLGRAFTVPAVLHASLKQYRILHFAAHALLPSELTCQSEPAIVTSDPAGATNAKDALLTASDITQLNLDADLVILSACNSGGGGKGTAGESLSGLARAFFYAGARSLLVTHWSVSDQVAKYAVALTLHLMQTNPSLGVAGALRQAQLSMLDGAGKSLPAEIAHPFFWAPFAAIGDAGGETKPGAMAANTAEPVTQASSPQGSGRL